MTLFTTDNVLIETLLFVATFLVIHAAVCFVYETSVIKGEHYAIALILAAFIKVYHAIHACVIGFPQLPSYVYYWFNDDGGKAKFRSFFEIVAQVMVVAFLCVVVIAAVVNLSGTLFVGLGLGHYCVR